MPLSPADVHNVAFKKPSLGKRGYDEDEVDAFLDVVEAELSRLIEENAELISRLAEFDGGAPAPLPVAIDATSPNATATAGTATAGTPTAGTPTAVAPATPAASGNEHVQAARLLALAQETADRLTEEARAESEKLLTEAKSHSEALVSDASTRAEAAERESKLRAEALDTQAKAKYAEVLGNLSNERVGLEKKIQDLRKYEREYRGRLKSWISDQLAQLDVENAKDQQTTQVLTGPGE